MVPRCPNMEADSRGVFEVVPVGCQVVISFPTSHTIKRYGYTFATANVTHMGMRYGASQAHLALGLGDEPPPGIGAWNSSGLRAFHRQVRGPGHGWTRWTTLIPPRTSSPST